MANNSANYKATWLTIALVGFSSVVTQVILLREMLNIFSGNELITGIVLSSWMLLTGLGAWIGSSGKKQSIIRNILWLGMLPMLCLTVLYFFKYLIFPKGILINIWFIFLSTLLILAPYCILSGHLFTMLTDNRDREKKDTDLQKNSFEVRADKLYALETMGSLVGGLWVSFVLIFWFSNTQSLLLIFFMHLLVVYTLQQPKVNKWKYLITAILVLIIFFLPTDIWMKKLVFPNQEILKTRETPYGNVTVTKNTNQINVFKTHELFYSTKNIIGNEETVHYPMLQHPDPKNVLLVSDGTSDLIKEILKYKTVRHIDYVEENKWLWNIMAGYDTLPADKRINVIYSDIRKFLRKNSRHYDVVILNVPEPSTLQINRFYTLEFFQLLRTKLTDFTFVSLSLPSAGNYYSKENMREHALILNTLKHIFPYVLIIPGERDYVIASNKAITGKIADLSILRGVETAFVNQYYIDDYSLGDRIRMIEKKIIPDKEINRDFKPMAVYYSSDQYLSKFSMKTSLFTFLPLILLFLPVFWLKPQTIALYISGFSVSSLEVFLLLSFQIVFGFIYAASGIIISFCMAGLAVGSYIGWKRKYLPSKNMILLNQFLLGIISSLFIWVIAKNYFTWNSGILYLSFALATLVPSICAGLQFSNMVKRNEAGGNLKNRRLYSAELFGSALGAAVISNLLLPYFGIISLIFIIAGLNGLAVLILAITQRNIEHHL